MSKVVVLPGAEGARLAATGVLLSRPQCSSIPECRTVYGLTASARTGPYGRPEDATTPKRADWR